MQLFIKTCAGQTICLDVTAVESVRSLKDKLCEKCVGNHSQLGAGIAFRGTKLEEDHTLQEYGIQKESTLHCFWREPPEPPIAALDLKEAQSGLDADVERVRSEHRGYPIVITLLSGVELELTVAATDTVLSLQEKVKSRLELDHPRDKLELYLENGHKLDGTAKRTLGDAGVLKGSQLSAIAEANELSKRELREEWYPEIREAPEYMRNPFEIFVETLNGAVVTVQAGPETTILMMKCKVWDEVGVPVEMQRMVFAGMQLEDERLLQDYNIDADCRMHVVTKIWGGGNPHLTAANHPQAHLFEPFMQGGCLPFK